MVRSENQREGEREREAEMERQRGTQGITLLFRSSLTIATTTD